MRMRATGGTISGMTVIATLTVERPAHAGLDRTRAYQILVDGTVKGTVQAGEELSLALPPGRHTVRARRDWTGSDDLPIHLGSGATVRLRVEPRSARHALGRRYLRLTRVD
jgi:hypothetical protein